MNFNVLVEGSREIEKLTVYVELPKKLSTFIWVLSSAQGSVGVWLPRDTAWLITV